MKLILFIISCGLWLGCETAGAPSQLPFQPVEITVKPVTRIEGSTADGDSLLPPFPNPYNRRLGDSMITIRFSIADSAEVKGIIQNPIGDSVAIFNDELLPKGEYAVRWTPLNPLGEPLREGLYFVTLRVDPKKRNYIDSRLIYVENND